MCTIGRSLSAAVCFDGDGVGQEFAYYRAYRTKPVVDYIAKTKLWADGKRDILDWGCGGGSLSRALAERGANNILAVDISDHAIRSASKRLESFPNTAVEKPRSIIPWHSPGTINFDSKFDIVISYRGALSRGSTEQDRIGPLSAMVNAAKACRDGGSVILVNHAIHVRLRHIIRTAVLVVVFVLAIARTTWVAALSKFQLLKLSLAAVLLCPSSTYHFGYVLSLVHGVISSKYSKWIMFLCGNALFDYIYNTIKLWEEEFKTSSNERDATGGIMRKAGLSDVKVTRKICFLEYEPLPIRNCNAKDRRVMRWNINLYLKSMRNNYRTYPSLLCIYEGTKERRQTLQETLKARMYMYSLENRVSKILKPGD